MICVTVIYPTGPDSRFNRSYYIERHIPLAKARLGTKRAELMDGKPGLDGSSPAYHMLANLYFGSSEELQNALAKHGAEVMADIPNYTNVQPIIYVGEVLA